MSIKSFIFSLRIKVLRLLPIKHSRIVFICHCGKSYGCNPRYLCEYINKTQHEKYELILLWDFAYGAPPSVSSGIRVVKCFSWEAYRMTATARFVISNTRIPKAFNFVKRKDQRYIQTWHSSLRLKKIEGDAHLSEDYQAFAKFDSKQIDLIISGCGFSSKIFSKAFWYNGKILECGTPRVDWLLSISDNDKKIIKDKINLNHNVKHVLYAPTFRTSDNSIVCGLDVDLLTTELAKKFGGEWHLLFRLHPNLKGCNIHLRGKQASIVDVTDYEDIQELLAISEVLITDYSSSMFDTLYSGIKCFLYAPDILEYTGNERELYFSPKDLPFTLAEDNSQLAQEIQNFDLDVYNQKVADFLSKIDSFEQGKASEIILKKIIERTE